MRHPWIKYLFLSFTVLGLLGAVVLAVSIDRDLSRAEESQRARTAEFWENNLENFLADREVLLKSDLFTLKMAPAADAGPLLNTVFAWTSASTSSSVRTWNQDHAAANGESAEAQRDSTIVESPVENFVKLAVTADLSKWSLSWAERLKEFDHWNIASNSPLATDWNTQSGMRFAFNTALPDFAAIQFAARVLYLRGLRDKNFETRAEQTRQLARLLFTVPTLVSQMVGVSILNQELLIREKLMSTPQLRRKYAASETPRFGRLQTSAYTRYVWGYVEGISQTAPQDVLETLLSQPGSQIGFCPALIEQVDLWKLNLDYGEQATKVSLQNTLEKLAPLIENCDNMPGVARLREVGNHVKFDFNDFRLAPVSSIGWVTELALKVPLARQYAVRYMNIVARPDFGSTYQRLHNESQP
jgi:hypothetical protein